MSQWSPRYLEYCRQTGGGTPERTGERDRERWPGGANTGFILWINARWREWEKLTGRSPYAPVSTEDHGAFDRWLAEREPERQAA